MYVTLRRNGWTTAGDLEEAATRSTAQGEWTGGETRWIRRYALRETDGSLGTGRSGEDDQHERLGLRPHSAATEAARVPPAPTLVSSNSTRSMRRST